MSGFDAAWLRLREPHDAVARAPALTEKLALLLPARPIHVIDLGAGTAANLRYLSPRLGGAQTWSLIDHDQALLDTVPARLAEWAGEHAFALRDTGEALSIEGPDFHCSIRRVRADLAGGLDAIELPTGSVVSAAALLDLVSDTWLQALVQRCRHARAYVLFALSYDGRIEFEPHDPQDATIRTLVNRHQLREKSFGPALGPMAGPRVIEMLQQHGYQIASARSDWQLGADDRAMQTALLEGWLAAAVELAPQEAAVLASWAERRRTHLARGQSALTVGHIDLLGWLPD